jgi:hypothetical protein
MTEISLTNFFAYFIIISRNNIYCFSLIITVKPFTVIQRLAVRIYTDLYTLLIRVNRSLLFPNDEKVRVCLYNL